MKKRRIIRLLKINEISAVDRPAQEGACVVIIKRDGRAELEPHKQEARINKISDPTAIRKSAEDLMDRYAESIRKNGESFEAAFVRACSTDFGASVLANIDDAYRLQVGQMTSDEVAKAAEKAARG